MQFKKGVSVLDNHDEKVGEIDRVVIDPQSAEVTHVVVRKGFLFTEDKVLPVDQISRTSDDAVHLNVDAKQVEEMPDYIETNYLPLDSNQIDRMPDYQAEDASPVYWYPVVGAAPLNWGGGYWGMTPPVGYGMGPGEPGYRVVEERNIPEGTVALKEGAKVLGKDGKHVGDVEKVLTENMKDQVTHLVVTKGFFGQTKKLIPAHWVRRIREDAVQLSVDEGTIERLRDYEE